MKFENISYFNDKNSLFIGTTPSSRSTIALKVRTLIEVGVDNSGTKLN